MIAKLELLLDLSNKEYDYNISSILHGIIMETISSEYASYLHNEQTVPYNISITNYKDKLLWTINTLNEEAYELIIKPFTNISEINMKQKKLIIKIKKHRLITTSYENLIDEYYYNNDNTKKDYTIYIQTPLAFKNAKDYIILPDLRLMLRSIMIKFDCFSNSDKIFDQEVISYLDQELRIRKYRIKSCVMFIHKQQIPGFVGELTINIKKDDIMNKLVSVLIAYSEYSGIGMKTALGMGSISLTKPQPYDINIEKESNF